MSNCCLINAQGLDSYIFYKVKNLKVKSAPKLKGWKDSPTIFKEIKKDIDIISFLIYQKETKYKFIDALITNNKLPSEFGYLPIILSGYQSFNQTEKGGAGIWSLSYITALHQGLRMDRLVDERKNDSLSTIAAIKELKRLLHLYKDPKLSILAFISSPSYVSNNFNEINSYESPSLETPIDKKYLDKIKFIYFLKELNFDKEVLIEKPSQDIISLQINNQLTFDAISQYIEIDFKEFQRYNPALINNIIPANYQFKIDSNHRETLLSFQKEIFSFQDSMMNNLFFIEDSIIKIVHEVQPGDVLGLIAEKYGVKIKDIMRWNNLQNTIIYLGQSIEVYFREEYSDQKFEYYEITENDSYWDISSRLPNHTLLDILKHNKYESIKTEKKLRIINK